MERQTRINLLRRAFAIFWMASMALGLNLAWISTTDLRIEFLVALAIFVYLTAWGLAFGLRSENQAGLLIGFGLCSASIALVIACFEVPGWAGMVDYRVPFGTPAPAWKRPGNAPDSALLFVRNGHQTLPWRFQGNDVHRLKGMSRSKVYSNKLHLDANGFRNPNDRESAEIVLIGDSFIESPHTPGVDLISTKLATATGQEVTNLGRSGYGPIQELGVLERYGLPLKPKQVVWFFYEGNDLADIREFDTARQNFLNEKPPTIVSWLYERSFAVNSLQFVIRNWLRSEATRDPNAYLGHFESRSGVDLPIYFSSDDYNPDSSPRAGSPEFDRLGSILESAATLCRNSGAKFTIAFVPTKWRVYHNRCGFEPEARCTAWPVDNLPTEIGELVKSRVPTANWLDLTPALEDASFEGKLVYLNDDTHWSSEGHALVSELIAKSLAIEPAAAQK